MVRETLGDEAVIVATREENRGKTVRVTAAVEHPDHYGDDSFVSPDLRNNNHADHREPGGWLQYDEEDEEGAVVEQLTDVMLRHSVPDEITDQVISCATVLGMGQADKSLTAALEHLFPFRPLPQKTMAKAFMMIGPPGAGKTLAVAKLAARGVMSGLKVSVISTDTIRAGGIEQLTAFTNLMRIKLQKASSPQQLKECLDRTSHSDQVFIDTGGMNPFAPEEMRELARLIAAGNIEPVMTLPAATDADESGEMARIYASLGVRSLVPTRLDIARRLGGLLAAAHHGSLIFADASNTPKVADGLIPLSPQRLAHLLMPQAAKTQSSSIPSKRQTAKTG